MSDLPRVSTRRSCPTGVAVFAFPGYGAQAVDTAMEKLCRTLERTGERLRATELRAMDREDDVCAVLVELLEHPSRQVVRLACEALVDVHGGGSLERRLLERLAAGEGSLRWAAAFVLLRRGVVGSRELEAVVLETLASDDRDTRWAAAQAACDLALRDPRFVDRLRVVARAADATHRKMVLHCLRRSGTGGESDFAAYLRDDDVAVRLAALAGLAVAPACSEATIDAVADLLARDSNPGVQCAAAFALGRIGWGRRRVRAVLARVCRDAGDPRLRRVAAESLRRLAEAGRT